MAARRPQQGDLRGAGPPPAGHPTSAAVAICSMTRSPLEDAPPGGAPGRPARPHHEVGLHLL